MTTTKRPTTSVTLLENELGMSLEMAALTLLFDPTVGFEDQIRRGIQGFVNASKGWVAIAQTKSEPKEVNAALIEAETAQAQADFLQDVFMKVVRFNTSGNVNAMAQELQSRIDLYNFLVGCGQIDATVKPLSRYLAEMGFKC